MSIYSSILYKAGQRRPEIFGETKSFSTFNSNDVQRPLRKPFGPLIFLDDIFLSPGEEISYRSSEYIHHIILPVTGGISYANATDKSQHLSSEEVLFFGDRDSYTIKNSDETTNVNYLHLGLRKTRPTINSPAIYGTGHNDRNALVSLNLDKIEKTCYAGLAIYQGKTKAEYTLKNPGNGLFTYVINGAFEMEDQLMEYRDGLARWNLKEIKYEALSEFSMLLLLEIPPNNN